MLNFKNTNRFFGLLLLLLLIYDFFYLVPVFIYILILIIYTGILFYGSYFVHSNFYLPVTCAAKTNQKEIALSFDDGPADQYTESILKILKENQVESAFFCIGKNIRGREHLLKQIHAEGHMIGNHSYTHGPLFDLLSSARMLADLQLMDQVMKEVLSLRPRIFRPPYGVTNPNLAQAIRKGGYTPVGWSIRSLDTVNKDEKKLFEKITTSLHPGAIILFHDTSRTTLAILPALITHVKEKGYQIRRLDKLLKLDPYV
jgi:peptidoglycan/xylan/chitin deacetylase (PgdA/CDA1 family)